MSRIKNLKSILIIILALTFIGVFYWVKIDKEKSEKFSTIQQEDNREDKINAQDNEVDDTLQEEQKKTEEEKEAEEQKEANNPKEVNGFVLLKELDKSVIIDLRYATENNFTKQKIYPNDICVLRKDTALKLVSANEEFKKLGYRIKIWDAYRPVYVQRIFWDIVKDSRFVANPDKGGSIHNKGCAVDITLVDKDDNE